MIVQVEKFMRKWNMVPEGGRVLVGVSGGADSVCLCLILYELSTKMNFSLEVIHVEHGIRGEESKNDAVFVEQLCKQRGIVCHIRNVDVPRYAKIHHLGEEEAARILRYQVFADAAGQDRNVRIALAHHMEDNAETMLFQLIRGSGLDGLCVPAVLHDRTVIIAIPLVYMFSIHSEIIAYCRKCSLHGCRRILFNLFVIPYDQINHTIR